MIRFVPAARSFAVLVAMKLALPLGLAQSQGSWQTECPACAQHLGGPGVYTYPTREACEAVVRRELADNFPFTPCHPVMGSAGTAQNASTGSLTGDIVNMGAQSWILQNIKNPYTATFAQNFTQSFLTSFVSGMKQREAIEASLRVQQEEQARLAREAEQRRLDAIFARLNGELKLSGVDSQLAFKIDSEHPKLAIRLSNSDGPLQLKLGETQPGGYGLQNLPGIYVGGPGSVPPTNPAAETTGGLQLKMGDGPTAQAASPAATEGGIPGLPGIFLTNLKPEQAAQVAEAATAMDGPEQAIVEDAALAAAQKNPALTAASDDPLIEDLQQQTREYTAAVVEQQAALAKASEAQGHVQADEAALNYARGVIQAGSATDAEKHAFTALQAAEGADEELAVAARAQFDSAEIHVAMKRDEATMVLASLAPPGGAAGGPASAVAPAESAAILPRAVSASPSAPLSTSAAPSLPVLSANARPQLLRGVQTPVTHPIETVEACLARSEPAGAQPSLEELDRKLEGAMKAIEQLARSEENNSELGEEWREYVRKAQKDMIDHGVDAVMDGFLGVTKTTLDAEKRALKEPLEESMKEAQQLRWEYQATAGLGTPNAVVQQRIADYKRNAQALLEHDGALREHLEDVERFEGTVKNMKSGKEFGEWLLGEKPCKRETAGELNCEALKKENGVSKFLQGDTETQADLLKKVMDFGVHYSPAIKLLAHGNLIVDTWDIGSLVIDLGYDASVLYAANNAAMQMSQMDAKMGQARATLNARVERLNAEIGCYRQAGAGASMEAAR